MSGGTPSPDPMPKFSNRSLTRLESCHDDLITLFQEVVRRRDCSILCGSRTIEEQRELVAQGRSKTMNSKHLIGDDLRPVSHAVDVMPYPIDWHDRERICLFAGFVLGIAHYLREDGIISHAVTWGGDWDGDGVTKDHRFFDGPHFQLENVIDDDS